MLDDLLRRMLIFYLGYSLIAWHVVCSMQLCDLIKSRVECPDFLEKLEYAQASVSLNAAGTNSCKCSLFVWVFTFRMLMKNAWSVAEEGNSWDFVSENDLWEGEDANLDQEDYVLVKQEDIVEGIACFMAAYLLSLKQTKVCYPCICYFRRSTLPMKLWPK